MPFDGSSPVTTTLTARVPATAGGADATSVIARAPYDGRVAAITYVPDTVLTGANTNSRTLSVVNKGAGGAGTATPATKAFVTGVNAPAVQETPLTLSVTPSDLQVAAGDILVLVSAHVGTGIADPGGLAVITFDRDYA